MTTLFEDLRWRGLVYQVAGEDELPALLSREKITLYIGFDPSADSLTIGHLMQLALLRRFQKAGHRPIVVVGGATGMIGDPGGRSTERNLLSPEELAANVAAIRRQLERFLDFGGEGALLVDNAEWLAGFSFIEFLRDIGKHVTVNTMLSRESVKARLSSEHGISYTEFSYMLMQAYDFVHLRRSFGCILQCAGSDQFGNIVAGIDLARRLDGIQLYGLTTPLITRSDGQKLGKTAEGAVWLDPDKTSPYAFYQYLLNVPDDDAGPFLRYFTDLARTEIEEIETATRDRPAERLAQRRLAENVTRLVHGDEGVERARRASEVLFGGDMTGMVADELLEIFADVPHVEADPSRLGIDLTVSEALVASGLTPSKSEARRRLESGGVYLNNQRIEEDRPLERGDLISGSVVVLRSGKKNFGLLRFRAG